MKLNVRRKSMQTHEGGMAKSITAEQQLRRAVMACMLWEDQFYEDGETISNRIRQLVAKVDPQSCSGIAIEAREAMKLRHAPLLIVREMARLKKHRGCVAATLSRIIQRADELAEFMAIYWQEGREPLSAQVKKGLALAFTKFDAYHLAKYNRSGAVKLRDVLFLCHAKPRNNQQADLWKQLIDKTLASPDTWEVALSSGGDKKAHWERLIKAKKLGALALLRNLRNFKAAGVSDTLVKDALKHLRVERVLPFRFISAAKYAPQFEKQLEKAMLKSLFSHEKMTGHTALLVDVSGSMDARVSSKSDISRLDAACGVAMLLRELCEKVDIFTFSMSLIQVPARRGFALRDAIVSSQEHSGTPLGLAVKCIYAPRGYKATTTRFRGYGAYQINYKGQRLTPDRLIVITDEQSADPVPNPRGKGYMINVASYKNGVGYGPWLHIDGWSEAVVDYVKAVEHLA